MSSLKFVNINKIYPNNVQAVFDFNLEINDKEFVVFVGPSGCGKSTTLRMVAGLEEITDGELYIDDKLVNEVHPKDRDIAMVFQSYALYPHMSVYENMAFGLKIKRMPKEEINRRIDTAAEILGLKPYLKRKPKELSGGQRQRVALGRAIVREPKVFLMDEPLSNLDAKLRVQMRSEIIKIHQKVGATTIYVTHDQTEAMTMADHIVVMKDGYIQQIGTPEQVYNTPANIFVAGFIGSPSMNFLKGKYDKGTVSLNNGFSFKLDKKSVQKHDEYYKNMLPVREKMVEKRKEEIEQYNASIQKSKKKQPIVLEQDEQLNNAIALAEKTKAIIETKQHDIIFGVRPEDIYLKEDKSAEHTSEPIKLQCDLAELLGHERIVYTLLGEERIVIKVDAKWNIKQGEEKQYVFNLAHTHIFDEDSTDNILFGE